MSTAAPIYTVHTAMEHEPQHEPQAKSCLILAASQLHTLELDGPALKVVMAHQSHRLFPLRRIARIHIMGELDVGMNALLHCAEQQIPVAFFTRNGKLRCQLYYPVYENGVLAHWLEHIEFDEHARQLYADWLEMQRLHIFAKLNIHPQRLQQTQEHIRSILKRHWSQAQRDEAQAWLEGLLISHLSQLIVENGLGNQCSQKRRLLDDLQPVCQMWLHHQLAKTLLQRKHTMPVSVQTMVAFYQTQADDIEYVVRRMLVQLLTRLESII